MCRAKGVFFRSGQVASSSGHSRRTSHVSWPCNGVLQQLEPVKEAVNALAASASLQGDVLMAILDKSLPTASGLAGESVIPQVPTQEA